MGYRAWRAIIYSFRLPHGAILRENLSQILAIHFCQSHSINHSTMHSKDEHAAHIGTGKYWQNWEFVDITFLFYSPLIYDMVIQLLKSINQARFFKKTSLWSLIRCLNLNGFTVHVICFHMACDMLCDMLSHGLIQQTKKISYVLALLDSAWGSLSLFGLYSQILQLKQNSFYAPSKSEWCMYFILL